MIRTRFKKVLLVAPDLFPDQLLVDYESVKHVNEISNIFPALFELNPNLIILDYDFIGNDIEKILRRIKINRFYDKLKICCYKNVPNEKTDSLLKALGVDQFLYEADFAKTQKNKTLINSFNSIDAAIMRWVPGISN